MKEIQSIKGFTLIEIAIVVVISSLLIGGLLVPLSAQIENSRRSSTVDHLDLVKESILGFAMGAGRVPCPDTDGDGFENPVGGVGGCTSEEGQIPFVTLSVDPQDAWKQQIVYLVDETFADDVDGTGCGTPVPGVSFELCSGGNISVVDAATAGSAVAQNLPVALLSRGKHWIDDRSPEEQENTDGDSVLVDRLYTEVSGSEYDDIVDWISLNKLRFEMVSAGMLGS